MVFPTSWQLSMRLRILQSRKNFKSLMPSPSILILLAKRSNITSSLLVLSIRTRTSSFFHYFLLRFLFVRNSKESSMTVVMTGFFFPVTSRNLSISMGGEDFLKGFWCSSISVAFGLSFDLQRSYFYTLPILGISI